MTQFSTIHSQQNKTFVHDVMPFVPIKLGKRKRDDDVVPGDINHNEGESKSQTISTYHDQSFDEETEKCQNHNLFSKAYPLSLSENSKSLAQSQNTQESLYRRFKKRSKHSRYDFQRKDENNTLNGLENEGNSSLSFISTHHLEDTNSFSSNFYCKNGQSNNIYYYALENDNTINNWNDGKNKSYHPLNNRHIPKVHPPLRDYDGEEEMEDDEDYVYDEDLESTWSESNHQNEYNYLEKKTTNGNEYSSINILDNERLNNPDFFRKLVIVDKGENDQQTSNNSLFYTKSSEMQLPLTSGELRLRRDLEDFQDLRGLHLKYNVDIDRIIMITPSKFEIHLKTYHSKESLDSSLTIPRTSSTTKEACIKSFILPSINYNASSRINDDNENNITKTEAYINFPSCFSIEIGSKYPHEAPQVSVMKNNIQFYGNLPFIDKEGLVLHPLLGKEWTSVCTMLTVIEVISCLKEATYSLGESSTYNVNRYEMGTNANDKRTSLTRYYDYMTDNYVLESDLESDESEKKMDNTSLSSTASQVPSTCSTLESISISTFSPTQIYDHNDIVNIGITATGAPPKAHLTPHFSTKPQAHTVKTTSMKAGKHLSFMELMEKADSHIRENNLIMHDFHRRHRYMNENFNHNQLNVTTRRNPIEHLRNIRHGQTERVRYAEDKLLIDEENVQEGHN